MKFKTVAVVTAVVGCLLGAAFIFLGKLMLSRWQIEATDELLLLCRRIGVIYLGLSVLLFFARSAPVSTARTAISAGFATALSLLACLGVYEFVGARVGPGIFVSAFLEALLATGFIWVLFTEKK